MSWTLWIRQAHRWVSAAFTLGFLANAGVIVALGDRPPPPWVYLLAVIPLFLLLPSGLYLFVLPYVAALRRQRPDVPDPRRPA